MRDDLFCARQNPIHEFEGGILPTRIIIVSTLTWCYIGENPLCSTLSNARTPGFVARQSLRLRMPASRLHLHNGSLKLFQIGNTQAKVNRRIFAAILSPSNPILVAENAPC